MEDAQHGKKTSAKNITAQWKKASHVKAKKRQKLFNVFSITHLSFFTLEVAVRPKEQVVNTTPGPMMR